MKINVGRINSIKTQIPFNLHKAVFCQGTQTKKRTPIEENIGEILMRDRLFVSDYKLNALKDEYCKVVCEFSYDSYHENFLKFLIDNNYNSTFYLDGLPASFVDFKNNKVEYQGIPLGRKLSKDNYIFYNHLVFHIELQKEEDFSIENTIKSLKTRGEQLFMKKDELGGDEISMSSTSSEILSDVEDWIKTSEFSIRKFQITPFSIQHDFISGNSTTEKNENADYITYYNNHYKTNCYKKEYIIKDEIYKLIDTKNLEKVEEGKNFNFSNYHPQYGVNTFFNNSLISNIKNKDESNNTKEDFIEKSISETETSQKSSIRRELDKQIENEFTKNDEELYYPSINSLENLEYFRDSLIYNYYSPDASINAKNPLLLTYDIKFSISKKGPIYVSRWDHYMKQIGKNDSIHWWSIINSTLGILLTSGIVMTIFLRVINKDINYIQLNTLSTNFDEMGWKQVSGSVFLPPKNRYIFCAFFSSGIQLFCVITSTLICSAFGFSNPRNRGSLISIMILLFVIFSFISGYVSSRLFKLFVYPQSVINPNAPKPNWITNILITNLFYPFVVFTILFFVNFFLAYEGSSATLDIKVIVILLLLWILCSTPMTIVGGFFGIKQKNIYLPTKINKIPDPIHQTPFYLSTKIVWVFTGAIPFL